MNKNNFSKEACSIGLTFFLFSFFISFNATGMDGVKLSDPVEKKIVIQTTHQFYVRNYGDEVVFNPKEFDYKKNDLVMSPSIVAIHFLSAWLNDDKKVYQSYMSDDYRSYYKKKPGILPSKNDVGKVRLIRRVDIGKDKENNLSERVIIEFELLGDLPGQRLFKGNVQLGSHSGWKLISLPKNIISNNWDFDGPKKIVEVKESSK